MRCFFYRPQGGFWVPGPPQARLQPRLEGEGRWTPIPCVLRCGSLVPHGKCQAAKPGAPPGCAPRVGVPSGRARAFAGHVLGFGAEGAGRAGGGHRRRPAARPGLAGEQEAACLGLVVSAAGGGPCGQPRASSCGSARAGGAGGCFAESLGSSGGASAVCAAAARGSARGSGAAGCCSVCP